ncbi:unnamed protein product, partial [Rhizoctonia solani]
MLITKTHHDIQASNGNIRIFVISPVVQGYPEAKFPGVVVFSEIYQVTGPLERFAGQIASQGYVVGGSTSFSPSLIYKIIPVQPAHPHIMNLLVQNHLHTIPKIEKEVAAYDEDAKLSIDLLVSLPNCTGRVAATGMCLGGHLAFRAAFDPRILASVCFFGTDIHSKTLGKGKNDDSLVRVERGDLSG